MAEPENPFTDVVEFEDDAAYAWWRDAHPDGFVLDVRARRPPLLHRASCRDVDPDARGGRSRAKGARRICAELKPALRAWIRRELPEEGPLVARCPKCEP